MARLRTVAVMSVLCCWFAMAICESYPQRHHRAAERRSRTLTGNQIPTVRLLKRMARNFRDGYTARVTLVFKATVPVQVRWFRQHTSLHASDSEVPNMLPVEGDRLYTLSTMTSGYLIATTISVPAFKERFPVELETILTTLTGTMQYQLTTIIRSARDLSSPPEDVYSPEWLAVPPPLWTVDGHGSFTINCKTLVLHEKEDFTNEIVLFHAYENLNSRSRLLEIQKIFEVHRDTRNSAEEQGPITFQGRRTQLADRNVVYEVNMTATNASSRLEGVYQCVLERQHEKSYVISQLALTGHRSPWPKMPRVAFKSCAANNRRGDTVNLTLGSDTCLRCRGFGHPRPQVALFRGKYEVQQSASVSVSKFISVADAGLVEATYTFHGVSASLSGEYTCQAKNSHNTTMVPVIIVVSRA